MDPENQNPIPNTPQPAQPSVPEILPTVENTETPPFGNPTAPPVNSVPPTPEVPAQAEAPKSKLIPILVVMLIIVALGAAGLWAYQNYFTSPVTSPESSAQAGIPTATTDPTADWQTYTNPSATYSFKYPSGLGSDTDAAGEGFESIRFSYLGPAQTASGKTETEMFDGYAFIVTKPGLTTEFDPKTEAERQQTNSKEICQNVSEITTTTVDGFNAFRFSDDCLGEHITTFVSDDKNTYSITQFYGGENKSSYKTTTDQIISTFKFLEGSPIPSSSPTPSLQPG
jgi:hypothetical protein